MAIDRAPTPPPIWALLCSIWGIEAPLAQRLWRGLARCRWTEVEQWRRQLIVAEQAGDPETLAQTVCSPGEVVHVAELLAQSGSVTRRDANALEARVLQWVDASGAWK